MSTRCQTIIYLGNELAVKFYRHCDGYAMGHGLDLCRAVDKADNDIMEILHNLVFANIEIEPANEKLHGDIEYLYQVYLPTWRDMTEEAAVTVKHRSFGNTCWNVMYAGTPKEVRKNILNDEDWG